MKSSTLVLIIASILTVAIIGVSFLVLGVSLRADDSIERVDEADLILDRADFYLKSKEIDKAVNMYTILSKRYPGSEYSEKALRKLGDLYMSKGDSARAAYYYGLLLSTFPQTNNANEVRGIVEKIDMEIMQSPAFTVDIIEYVIQPGDSLFAIAKRYNTTVELLQDMNGLKGDMIRVGQKLKVNTAVFTICVDKYKNTLVLKKNDEPFKTYRIATGKNNITPVGTFTIIDKVVRPPWTKPTGEVIKFDDPEYELGERWMAISEPGYGIHGTNDDSSIGKQSTAGCIRMYNRDVIELYNIAINGTEVEIIDTSVGSAE